MNNLLRSLALLLATGILATPNVAQIISHSPNRDTILINGINVKPTMKWSLVRTLGGIDTVLISATKTTYISAIGAAAYKQLSFCVLDSAHQMTFALLMSNSSAIPPTGWQSVPPDSEITLYGIWIVKLLAFRNSVAVDSASVRFVAGIVLAVEAEGSLLANRLNQNYPNPFNPGTTITFDLKHSQEISVRICNVLGQTVATLLAGKLSAGSHLCRWNATGLPSGTYYCELVGEDFVFTKKLQLLK